MSVSADLQEAYGVHRRLFLRIDGYPYDLWQRGDEDPPDIAGGWSRDPLVCLHPPAQFSAGLDLSSMQVQVDAIQFELEDIEESVGVSRFGKLFASARWDANPHGRVKFGTAYNQYVDADAAIIPMEDSTTLPASGTAYIGQETFTYTGNTGVSLTGCTRGLYPCVGTNWGYTYYRPPDKTKGTLMAVGTVPFSWMGRRIALYITTWDRTTGTWNAEAQAEVLWVGYIDEAIDLDSKEGVWKLSSANILELLKTKIPASQPTVQLRGINLLGDEGRLVDITVYNSGTGAVINSTTGFALAVAGYYDNVSELYVEVNKRLNILWATMLWGLQMGAKKGLNGQGDVWAVNAGGGDQEIRMRPAAKLSSTSNHVLQALGYDGRSELTWRINNGGAVTHKTASYHVEYHPLHQKCNGGKLYTNRPEGGSELIADQGDNSTALAAVEIEDATLDQSQKREGSYFARYTGITAGATSGSAYLTLYYPDMFPVDLDSFVGAKAADNMVEVKQVYIPKWDLDSTKAPRGPFELIGLIPLLSTGTSGYNDATYDVLPANFAVGMQVDLVDKQSFLDADATLKSRDLAQRVAYVINEGTSFLEIIKRECQLFGFTLRWARGQLSLARTILPATDSYDVILDESNNADPNEWPTEERSIDTVINRYTVKGIYDATSGKWGAPITLTDEDSRKGLNNLVKEISIEHPGIYQSDKTSLAKSLLEAELIGRPLRFPSTVIQRTLAPTLINRLYPGDVARFQSSRIMDPAGSGTRVTDTYALALNVQWDLTEKNAYFGTATLMLLAQYSGYGSAWAPAALVDKSAANGGLGVVANRLTLVALEWGTGTDPDDGAVFEETWEVYIIERAPSDPTAPDIYGPYACAKDYEADGAQLLTLPVGAGAAITAAGWDATKEHVVVFADYDEVVAGQLTEATFQADTSSMLLGGADFAQRWGG